ncbi:MAG: head-tail connector protein [Alphaproteobacteria bacterium]
MKGLTRIAPPAAEPVTLAETKSHLRIDDDADDALITDLIVAGRQAAEEHLRRALVTQSWRLTLDRFPGRRFAWWDGVRQGTAVVEPAGGIELPRPPLASVTSVTVYDDADTALVVPAADYFTDTDREPGRIVPRAGKTWPTVARVANGVEIVFVAGYGAASDVPEAIRQGILALVAHYYEHREAADPAGSAAGLPPGVAALWRPFRVLGL